MIRQNIMGVVEKKSKGGFGFYLLSSLLGAFLVLVLVGFGIGLKWVIIFLIEYWVWAIIALIAMLFIRRFIFKKKEIARHDDPN